MDEHDIVRLFRREGFANGGPLLNAADLGALRADAEAFVLQSDPRSGREALPTIQVLGDASGPHYSIRRVRDCSAAFREVTENRAITALAAKLLDARTIHVWAETIHYKPAMTGGSVAWHQDGMSHALFTMGFPVQKILSAWIALDDADEESGCMWMVPGSHEWGDQRAHLETFGHLSQVPEIGGIVPPAGISQWREPTPCPVKAGDVHFHHAHTWHASPVNRSARVRRAYTIFYMADAPEGVSFPLVYPMPELKLS